MASQNSKGSAAPPPSRRDRREAARRDRRLSAARTAAPKPAWQSPMVLLSVGAVVIGLAVVLLASGVLGGRGNGGDTGDLLTPIRPTPPELTDPTNPRALATGSPTVDVEIWSDYQCPACGFWARTVEPDLVEEYVRTGKVRLIYRDFAFIDGGSRNGESQQSAAAARCAGEQGKYWQYHDYLMENQDGENEGGFRRERLDLIASTIGLDMDAFGSCLASDPPFDAVKAETEQGRQAGVGSTPTLAVNGVLQKAGALPMTDLRPILDAAIAAATPAPATPTPAP
jgi:protein-disulfide isomerase